MAACNLPPETMIGTEIARGSWVANWLIKSVVSWFTKSINQGKHNNFVLFAAARPVKNEVFFPTVLKYSRLWQHEM